MTIANHIKEHAVLGVPDSIAAEFDGIQPIINVGQFPVTHGTTGTPLATQAQAIYLSPFIVPAGKTVLIDVSLYVDANSATAANRFRWCIWDNTGNIIDSGISNATLTSKGIKTISFGVGAGIAISSKSFWFGFGPFEDGGTWEAVTFRTGKPQFYVGYDGMINHSSNFPTPSVPYIIALTAPTDAFSNLTTGTFFELANIVDFMTVVAAFS